MHPFVLAVVTNATSIFDIATKIDTPLSLAGLLTLVLYLLFRKDLQPAQAKMLFVLVLVAEVLSISAYVYVIVHHPPPSDTTFDGLVVSPPGTNSGLPGGSAFILIKGHPPRSTTTDQNGYYSFVIQPEDLHKSATIYISAKGYKDSEQKSLTLDTDNDRVDFGLQPIPTQSAQTTATARPATHTPSTAPVTPAPDATCLNGTWREHLVGTPDTNQMFTWTFAVNGQDLVATRSDNFATLNLHEYGTDWRGDLKWGTGDVWKNVALTPTADCRVIDTNQGWIYGR